MEFLSAMQSLRDRLKRKTIRDESTGCLLYIGYRDEDGYGDIAYNLEKPKVTKAHRASAFFAGIIPSLDDPHMVCHHCDNPPCIEPSHLYAGDALTNRLDAIERNRSPKTYNITKTHCCNGHALVGDNVDRYGPSKQYRRCVICRKANSARWRQKQVAC